MNHRYVSAAGVRYVRDCLIDFPRPDQAAAQAIRQWAARQGTPLDPDRVDAVTLHYQYNDKHGWVGVVAQKMSLTQAVLANWQGESDNDLLGGALGAPWAGHFPDQTIRVVDKLQGQGLIHYGSDYSIFNGLFQHSDPQEYSARTHVAIDAEAFERFIWSLDFRARYKAMLDRYWDSQLQRYRLAAKINFIAACNKQSAEGSLSQDGRRLALQVAGVEKRASWTALGFAPRPRPTVQVNALNVYGYAATDLLCLTDHSNGLTLLYIPGNASPLHEFPSEHAMQDWFARQCQDTNKRAALLAHFPLADRPDGLSYSGLQTALAGLGSYPKAYHLDPNRPGFTAEGIWSPQVYINYKPQTYSPAISDELFLALARRQQRRSYKDADYTIISDDEVTKAKWRGYLYASINLLAPLAFVVPELAPLFALGGIAQFGLGLDQALHARSRDEQSAGIEQALFGLLNATPLLHGASAPTPEPFCIENPRFVSPSRLNGQLGYPLSPMDPPHWPEPEIADAFQLPRDVAPLPGADEAVAGAVIRVARYTGEEDLLQGYIDGYPVNLSYDLERDAFVIADEVNAVDPQLYVAPAPGSLSLRPLGDGPRVVTDQARMRSLKALGIDLALPIDFRALGNAAKSAIPKTLSSLWVGDKVMSPELIDTLANNARLLKDSPYRLRLYLSGTSRAAHAENLRLLMEKVPDLEVLELETQSFYQTFSQSPYFAQYQAAIAGNGGVASNYASASDILRYRLLYEEGGLYMDLDDRLLTTREYLRTVSPQTLEHLGIHLDELPGDPNQQAAGRMLEQAEILNEALDASPEGLLLHPPMSNQLLGMNVLYNTSMIGSHAGNPTLEAICEEIHLRYQRAADFYDSKPDWQQNPQAFQAYAKRLSWLSGPGVFNDVIDRLRPELYCLRQMESLQGCPIHNTAGILDEEAYGEARSMLLPLYRVARVGQDHSWTRT